MAAPYSPHLTIDLPVLCLLTRPKEENEKNKTALNTSQQMSNVTTKIKMQDWSLKKKKKEESINPLSGE